MQAYIGLIGACSARQKQTGNKSVRKIIINNTINLGLLFKTAISILVVSNHSGFRVLFDETGLLPCILFEKHILYFSIGNGQPQGTSGTMPTVPGRLSFPVRKLHARRGQATVNGDRGGGAGLGGRRKAAAAAAAVRRPWTASTWRRRSVCV